MLDIYLYASCLGIYPPLFTSPLGDSCILFTLRAAPPLSSWLRRRKKEALPTSHQTFGVAASRIPGLVNLVLSRQTGFFECKRLFIDIPVVITKPTVASALLLALGWKLYPSNMLFMRNEYLYSNHADYFSSTPKSSKQNKVSAGGWLLFPLRSTVFIWLWAELFLHKLKLKLSEIWAQEGYVNCTRSKFWDLGL